jgi:spore maturation protein B
MMGSTETIFYTMAVYMGGSGIKKATGVLPAALAANLVSAVVACMLCA